MRALILIPGVVCLFLGGIFLLVFRRSDILARASERSMTEQCWAQLVDMGSRTEYNYENRSHTVYYGVYEFDSADGQHISSASDFGYCNPKDVPGTQGNLVKVCYNPKAPTEFALLEEQAVAKTVWPKFRKVGFILSLLGILLTAAAIAVMLGLLNPFAGDLINQAEEGSISLNYSFGG